MTAKKTMDYYLNLPWTYTVERESYKGKSYYVIFVNELPGICTDSEDLNEGMEGIKEAIACAVEIYQEKGEPVPEPIDKAQYKGRISYRTDSKRHCMIARAARLRHKSINKTIDALIDVGLQELSLTV